jgi:tRNA-Thr(GGU) m(6)t(6)A37 methyltransferase TsaA
MTEIKLKQIGTVHSPFKKPEGTPIQPAAGKDIRGSVEIFPEYVKGLKDLEGFSHILLLCYFHLAKKPRLLGRPYMDDEERGIFAIRGPSRPNPIGLSTVRLEKIEGNMLYIRDLDIIDGTPLLDIKPYVPDFDSKQDVRFGWLEKKVQKLPTAKDDGRFAK